MLEASAGLQILVIKGELSSEPLRHHCQPYKKEKRKQGYLYIYTSVTIQNEMSGVTHVT